MAFRIPCPLIEDKLRQQTQGSLAAEPRGPRDMKPTYHFSRELRREEEQADFEERERCGLSFQFFQPLCDVGYVAWPLEPPLS